MFNLQKLAKLLKHAAEKKYKAQSVIAEYEVNTNIHLDVKKIIQLEKIEDG